MATAAIIFFITLYLTLGILMSVVPVQLSLLPMQRKRARWGICQLYQREEPLLRKFWKPVLTMYWRKDLGPLWLLFQPSFPT